MVSIAKLPGAKPRPVNPHDHCPKCARATLIVARGEEYELGGMVDQFVRCVVCDYRGPLGGLRLVK